MRASGGTIDKGDGNVNRELARRIAAEGEYMPTKDEMNDVFELEAAGLVELASLHHPVAVTYRIVEDRTMKLMRKCGFTGPITRRDYLDFIHATDEPQEPDAEMESLLPLHLQDWEQFEKKK
jgi:hypothetical protein